MTEYKIAVVHKSYWTVKVNANTWEEAFSLAKDEVKELTDRSIILVTGKGERKGLNQDSSIEVIHQYRTTDVQHLIHTLGGDIAQLMPDFLDNRRH